MKRRTFLKNSAQVGAGIALSSSMLACMEEHQNYVSTIGLQLWTVRNQLEENPLETLKAIKKHGYHQVELMDTEQIKTLMPLIKDVGLAVNSSFMNFTLLTGRWDLKGESIPAYTFSQLVEDAQKAGLTEIVFGYMLPGERATLDQYKKISDRLNEAGEECKSAGIQLCYHNHSFEFLPMEGSTGYDVLMERLDPELAKFELDVFWSSLGGVEPVELMKKLGNRVHLLHLKDKMTDAPVIYDEGKVPEETFLPLGKGSVNMQGVLKQAQASGVKYCLVEQDQSPDPIQDIGVSMSYLENT
ncbi:MAG: sugar phosphate isomerase/epimerase [Bacteroidota bacterium]